MQHPTNLAVTANWLAYSPSLRSEAILAGCEACADDLAADEVFAVELPIAHMNEEIEQLDENFWRQILAPFQARGITVRSVHGPTFSYDRFPLDVECERMRRYARAAQILGASSLVVHPVFQAYLHVCSVAQVALDRDVSLATALGAELAGGACRLAIENVPHNSWAYLQELFRRLPDAVGMCFDTGHYLVRPELPLGDALRAFAPRIACWHLNDNHALCDEHLAPGLGSFPWQKWSPDVPGVTGNPPRVLELSLPWVADQPQAREMSRSQMRAALSQTRTTLQIP